MNIKKYLTLLLVGLASMVAWGQNTLSAPSLTGGQGKNVVLPISMENADEVVAVQFCVQLPFGKTSSVAPTLNASRNTNGHTVSVRSMGGNKYTVVIVNMNNRPLAGSGGTLVNMPMTVPTGLEPEAVYPITLSDVVITNRKGDNIATGSTDGSYTIQRAPSPDLEVSNVQMTATDIIPGQTIDFSWRVSNLGQVDTRGGWTEKVYLVNADTEESVYLGYATYNSLLVKGGYTLRNVAMKVPETIGLEGNVTARVVVEPSSQMGEYVADRANNTAQGGQAVLQKRLFLTAPTTSLKEGESMRLTLKRSGDRSMEETYQVSTSLPSAVTVPATVTLPAGQAAVSLTISIPQNEQVNDYSQATVSVARAHGYPEDVQVGFTIEDDELLPLTVKLDKSEYNEGETMRATISVPYRIGDGDLTVTFGVEKPKRFRLPASYTFQDGATTAVVEIPILQDNVPANVETVQLTVSAPHHLPGTAMFILNDDDVPAIEMTMTPTTVSEAAGSNAIYGTITRSEITDSKITIKLTDDSDGQLYYTGTLTMPAGTTSITFPIGVRDNQRVDGDRQVRVTASVYITDCGCDAIGNKQSTVTLPITITDNDGPALAIAASRNTILEGNAEGTTLTISRNNETTQPLTVQLVCQAQNVTFPATVTIPAGQQSVQVPFVAQSNATQEGNRTVTIEAVAEGYSRGSAWVLISDQTLPDAHVRGISVAAAQYSVGDRVRVAVAVENVGAAPLPIGTPVVLTMNGKTLVETVTMRAIPVAATDSLVMEFGGAQVPGQYELTASVNAARRISELQYLNNTATCPITFAAQYAFQVSTERTQYLMGDTVTITGTATDKQGHTAAGVDVEVYLLYANARTPISVQTDQQGRFTTTYVVPQGMGGTYTYGACYPGENVRTGSNFDVLGLARTTDDYIKHQLFVNEPYVGKLSLKNLSGIALHNIKCTYTDETGAYQFFVPTVQELPANGTTTVDMAITVQARTNGIKWDEVVLHFVSDEGAKLDVTTYNFTSVHQARLVADANSINTTVNHDRPRLYPLVITNMGLEPTGRVTVSLPQGLSSFISLATPAEMPSMATGDSATIMLRFNGSQYDVNLIQKGNIAINCESGTGLSIPFNVKVVSDLKGNLLVRVQDENTIYGNRDGEHPYVSGAQVRLTDYNTGAVVASDLTGQDGSIQFDDIDEGVYQLYVTASKHDSYRQNLIVSPGVTTEHVATISYQAISVSWNVEETEVEDVYDITTSLNYETRVPVPVVTMEMPDTIPLDLMSEGETMLINVVLWNRGLIAAQDVQYHLQEVSGFTFTPLVPTTGVVMPAETSYVIPILITRDVSSPSGDDPNNPNNPGGGGSSGGSGGDNGGNNGGSGTGSNGGSGSNGGTSGGSGSNGGSSSGGGSGSSGGSGSGNGSNGNNGGDGGNGSNGGGGGIPCTIKASAGWGWPCGDKSKYAWLADVCQARFNRSNCVGSGNGSAGFSTGGTGGPGTPGNFDVPTYGASGSGVNFEYMMYFLCVMLECLPVDVSPPDCVKSAIKRGTGLSLSECAVDAAKSIRNAAAGKAASKVPGGSGAAAAANVVGNMIKCKKEADYQASKHKKVQADRRNVTASGTDSQEMPDLVRSYFVKAGTMWEYQTCIVNKFQEWVGAPEATWQLDDDFIQAIGCIDQYLQECYLDGTLYDIDPEKDIPVNYGELFDNTWNTAVVTRSAAQHRAPSHFYRHAALTGMMPNGLAQYQDFNLRTYVQRWQNDCRIGDGLQPVDDNYTRTAVLDSLTLKMDSCEASMVKQGFVNWKELCISANKDKNEFFEKESKNTCATVKLEISQKLVLTRQAFRGTLTMENGTNNRLTDIDLKVTATDLLGHVATSHEMQINFESITGFQGDLDGPWTLDGGATGVATILFIPTKYAAPDTLTTYSFGGTLYFNDGQDNQVRSLYPVSLQVKPSPELDLTYFMQRDVMGDNPLTEEVEPVVPAEFTVLIHNKGRGDANNVKMLTQQPTIVSNEKGLLADFAIVSSSINGGEKALPLDSTIATPIGTIPAGTCSYATWDLTCNLMGHFTDYNVRYTHVTDYGNPDLSLLDRVTIHELIHSVNAVVGDKTYRAWVTNDYEDGHSEPDHIYLSDGTDEDLQTLTGVTEVEKLEGNRYRITVTVPQKQWFYTSVANPGGAYSRILYLHNEDTNQELDPDNFWTSDYTMQDGMDPLLDYRLHIVDLTAGPETRHYIVEFEPMPEKILEVEKLEPANIENKMIEAPVEQFTVTFNKDIDHTTFSRSDLVLRYEGEILDTPLPITRQDGTSQRTFVIDASALTQNGYYHLTVNTDSITDQEGFLGREGKQIRWMLFKDGLVHYNVGIWPNLQCGGVESSTGDVDGDLQFGQTLTLTAKPMQGYAFQYWAYLPLLSGSNKHSVRARAGSSAPSFSQQLLEQFSTDPQIEVEMDRTQRIYAVFQPIPYSVTIACDSQQGSLAAKSGIYDYGTELVLDAHAAEGFALVGYRVNGEMVETTEPYTLRVEGITQVEAVFADLRPQDVMLSELVDYVHQPQWDGRQSSVSFYRSFRKGCWNTICLPCDVNDPNAVFGDGTRVLRLTGIEDGVAMFGLVENMQANVPYLIQPGRLASSLYADGSTPQLLYTLGLTELKEADGEPADVYDGITYVGTYTQRPIDTEDGNYYLSSDMFYFVDQAASVTTGRYRGYIHVDEVMQAKLYLGIDGTTAVRLPLDMVPNPSGIYNASGVMVRRPGDNLQGLKPGLYITHGRKVMVR